MLLAAVIVSSAHVPCRSRHMLVDLSTGTFWGSCQEILWCLRAEVGQPLVSMQAAKLGTLPHTVGKGLVQGLSGSFARPSGRETMAMKGEER